MFFSLLPFSRYAVRENNTTIKLHKNFKERKQLKPDFGAEQIFGGHLLGVRTNQGLAFYDWETCDLIRRIEITPKNVSFSTILRLDNLKKACCFLEG